MDTLYVPEIIKVKINLPSIYFDKDYEQQIKRKIKDKYGDTCNNTGYMKKSSIEIVNIGVGTKTGSHLSAVMTYPVQFKVLQCIPRKDKIIRCRIQTLNKFGARARLHPMEIIVPRQIQQYYNMDVFATLKEGDYVYVKSLNYSINQGQLTVIGYITELSLEKPNSLEIPNDALITQNYQNEIILSPYPPLPLTLLGSNESLNQLKDKITIHLKSWEETIKYLINPYELIDIYRPDSKKTGKKFGKNYQSIIKYDITGKTGLYPIFSRAYFKLWEIIAELKLLDQFQNKPIRIGNLAEGPGGFIHALIDYRKQQNGGEWKSDEYFGITLKKKDSTDGVMDWNHPKPSEYFNLMTKSGYQLNLTYGSGSGDLLDVSNIKHYVEKDLQNRKCHLVTADGGIELRTDEEYALQELANAKLFFSEILTALSIQEKDGIFILKIYDVYHHLTLQMIILLSIYYDSLTIIKPRTSRPANSEKYIVCRGFNGISTDQLNQLYEIFDQWLKIEKESKYVDNDQYINSIFRFIENSGSEFVNNLIQFNEYNITMQIEKITEGLNLIETGDINKNDVKMAYKQSQKNLAEKWCEMFNVPYIKDLKLQIE